MAFFASVAIYHRRTRQPFVTPLDFSGFIHLGV